MITQGEIDIALLAADQPVMVESQQDFQTAMQAWLNRDVIGIDTEFVRERTWRADLGLVQLSDGKTVWLLDPLQFDSLQPLAELFDSADIIKILHAPSEDLDVLLYNTGVVPRPMFDTQLACALLGESLQMGYHKTVEWLLGIEIDKGETRSNWLKRPLRPAQLHYAALDVCLLPMMFRKLRAKLVEKDRLNWLEEDAERLLDKALLPAEPEQSWKRFNGNGRLDGSSLALLQALSLWRENEAEERNLARGFVIKDNALMTIVNKKPRSVAALSEMDIWHPRAIQRHGQVIISIIDKVIGEGISAQAPDMLLPKHRPMMKAMRELVNEKAIELSIDPALLASRRELESLILSPPGEEIPERFNGWRHDIITTGLLEIKNSLDS